MSDKEYIREKRQEAEELTDIIFEKLFSEEGLSDEAYASFERWISGNPDDANFDRAFREALAKEYSNPESYKLSKEMWPRMAARLWMEEGKKQQTIETKRPNKRRLTPLRRLAVIGSAAAVLALLLTIGNAVWWSPEKTGGEATEQVMARATAPIFVPEKTVKAENSERLVTLPDGSKVTLGANSTLEYGNDFEANRVVRLDGGAFFSVVKHEGSKFEVLAHDVTVRVHGTEFHVNKQEDRAEVILTSGKVEVIKADHSVMLEPNQHCVYELDRGHFSVFDLEAADVENKLFGKLCFDATPLSEALRRTGDFFGMPVEIRAAISDEPVRITFGMHDELDDVLYSLQTITRQKFKYEISTDRVIIHD